MSAAIVEGVLLAGDLEIEDGRVVEVGLRANGGGGLAVPGFVDLQVNGFGGVDFAEADRDGYRRAGEALLATGVTAFQPTFVTAPEASLAESLAEMPTEAVGPRVIGAHLEGPFLSPKRMGAHPLAARRDPEPELLGRLLAAGPVTQMTLAPELPGALELIELLHDRGVVVSCGHSDATARQAQAAFDRGATTITHLFNAMRPLSHRDPGIAGAALARDDVTVQIILDGHHLAEETVRLIWRAAAGRTALVTDAVAPAGAGLADGAYTLSGAAVDVLDGVVRRSEDGVLAGSTLLMIDAVRTLHGLGASLPDAIAAATSVPARIAKRSDLGVLRRGGAADLVVLDDRLEIRTVLVAGTEEVALRG